MRTDLIKMSMHNQPFMLDTQFLDKALSVLNNGAVKSDDVSRVANNNVVYEVLGNIAVISLDGAMYKKDMSGACGESVVSYTNIIKAINMAENDDKVETILFRVDTPGGSVAGADEVEDRIFNSSKKTVTLYENQGTSGGLYIFLASDHVYSTQNTILGSIGVIVTLLEEDGDSKVIHMTSKNADNKVCNLGEGCKARIQERIDTYEERFYELVMKNTGRTSEEIKTTFNNGDVVFADKALEAGFIDGIMTFRELLMQLQDGKTLEATPTANATRANTKNQGEHMELPFNEENFKAIQLAYGTSQMRLEEANVNLETANTALENKDAEITALKDAHEEALQAKAVEAKNSLMAVAKVRVAEALASGVSDADVIMSMIGAESDAEASKLAIGANHSEALPQVDGVEQEEEASDAVKAVNAYFEGR